VLSVARHVPWLLGALLLVLVGLDHGALDHFAAGGVDRVSNVGVELGAAVGVARGPVFVEPAAALVAEPRPQVVLAAARRAAIRQLAAPPWPQGGRWALGEPSG